MIETKITIRKLTAADGYVLTNGDTYGKEVYLGKNDVAENWNEITDAEYAEFLIKQEAEMEEV